MRSIVIVLAVLAAVTDHARVLVRNGGDFDVVTEGTNRVTCYIVGSSRPHIVNYYPYLTHNTPGYEAIN